MFPSLPRWLLVSCEWFFRSVAPSYAWTISCKFIILSVGGKFILASKSTVAQMFFPVCSAILPVCLEEKLCSQTFPLRQLPQFIYKHSPHHGWLTPSKTVSLSLLISFIPASPGSSVTLSDPSITALHMASWIFPSCCPSGHLCQFYIAAAGAPGCLG